MKRIVLIGNQICSLYHPVLSSLLKGKADLWMPTAAAETSVDLLAGAREWVLKRQPEVAVFAAGLLDTGKICFGESERLVPLAVYQRNVRCALKIVIEQSTAVPVWMTIPPVDVRRFSEEWEELGYDNETIALYNEEAKAVARALEVTVIDLYGIVKAASRADSRRTDGVRFDARGSDYIAAALADRLLEICRSA